MRIRIGPVGFDLLGFPPCPFSSDTLPFLARRALSYFGYFSFLFFSLVAWPAYHCREFTPPFVFCPNWMDSSVLFVQPSGSVVVVQRTNASAVKPFA